METGGHARGEGRLIDKIRRALDRRDFEAFAELYAEDSVLEEVSSIHPPSHPHVVRGQRAVLDRLKNEILRDPVSGWERHLTSAKIVEAIETPDALAFSEVLTFFAGDKVVAMHIARVADRRIKHDRVLVAWDTAEPG
jgi:hypothetical protein